MSKEKVYIVVSHKNSLRKGTKDQWEVSESVEFVNQLRTRHYSSSSAIGDFINRKMLKGERFGMTDYNKFEGYIQSKYDKQLKELSAMYRADQVAEEVTSTSAEVFTDEFGNVRPLTVFDKVS